MGEERVLWLQLVGKKEYNDSLYEPSLGSELGVVAVVVRHRKN